MSVWRHLNFRQPPESSGDVLARQLVVAIPIYSLGALAFIKFAHWPWPLIVFTTAVTFASNVFFGYRRERM